MEKEMIALLKFKSGDGNFEKFMGWMQSDEGMSIRKSVAHVEKTVPAIAPDKSYVMFKISVHNEEGLKELLQVIIRLQNPFSMNVLKVLMYGN